MDKATKNVLLLLYYFSISVNNIDAKMMNAWQLDSYGGIDSFKKQQIEIPKITQPNQVLIKVKASSVNPIDVLMTDGYGSTVLSYLRKWFVSEFPLILGRDFCGTVVSKGSGKSCENIVVGSIVCGVIPVHLQGCHAEYVLADPSTLHELPSTLTPIEAASLIYAGLTAWCGIVHDTKTNLQNAKNLKTLVLGASGGVGNAAVQILHAAGAHVTATCSTNAVALVESLGADRVLDYRSPDHKETLASLEIFDLIMDCAGLGSEYIVNSPLKYRKYVTYTFPLLNNTDTYGAIIGSIFSLSNLTSNNVNSLMKKGGSIYWGLFRPSSEGIKYLFDLANSNKMKVIVEKVFQFDDLPAAYKKVKGGHLRGKIAIDYPTS